MKNLYKTACVIGLCTLTHTTVPAQPDYALANYTPSKMGNPLPTGNNFNEARQKTSFVIPNSDPTTRLPAPVGITDLYAGAMNGAVEITWRTNYEPNLTRYIIEFSKDNITYQQVGEIPAGAYQNGKGYRFTHHPVNVRDRVWYRLRMQDNAGRFEYTVPMGVVVSGATNNRIFPTVVHTGVVSLHLNEPFETVQVVDMKGNILQKQILNGRTGRTDITLSAAARGICLVRVLGTQQANQPRKSIVQKIFIQ
jgi:hypothetical protein